MAHPQIIRARIEKMNFTLYYDYDQLRYRKLTRLTPDGKIEWFRRRMDFVFLASLGCLYHEGESPAFRALNSTKKRDLPARSFVIPSFAVLLNGMESLGSFLTGSDKPKVRFYKFVETYMKRWDTNVPDSPYAPVHNLKEILWEHFRNGIAHGFCIEGGGIDNEVDKHPKGWKVVSCRLAIGPHAFFQDFTSGVNSFFQNLGTTHRTHFLRRFHEVYPC